LPLYCVKGLAQSVHYSLLLWGMCIIIIIRFVLGRKDFIENFSRISEIRSLVPKDVNIMALSATANLITRTIVIESLDMCEDHVISQPPNKPSISYSVHGDEIR
jgi:hypothetical protein